MDSEKEKLALLTEMIEFAKIDGEIHEKEIDFIELVAQELGVLPYKVKELYENPILSKTVIKDEFNRICQFYRLALLMHSDRVIDKNEEKYLFELAIKMGLSPFAVKKVLKMMKNSPNSMIDPDLLIKSFQVHYN